LVLAVVIAMPAMAQTQPPAKRAAQAGTDSKNARAAPLPPCSGHGVADSDGRCTCAAGYAGAACNACVAGYLGYPNCRPAPNCGAHKHAGPGGNCVCDEGFTGLACDACLPGYFGPSCKQVNCNNHGSGEDGIKGTGRCTCDARYAGATCNTCSAGNTGYPNCLPGQK
jgi:hypothetical protein